MIAAFAADVVYYALLLAAFLCVISAVVFVHELGHFQVARWCGVTVTTFSIGFGTELWSRVDRHGTRWRIAAIPLGGYVKFLDDENAASQPSAAALDGETSDPGSFHGKPVWQRAAVVAAGPFANFIFAAVIYTLINMTVGVRSITPVIDEVVPGKPAAAAGMQGGDRITAIDGWTVESLEDVARLVGTAAGRELDIEVERDGRRLDFAITPAVREQKDELGVTLRIGDIGIRRIVPAAIGDVDPKLPAAAAGIKSGDIVRAIDGRPIRSFDDIVDIVGSSPGKPLTVTVERAGTTTEVAVTPLKVEAKDASGKTIEKGRIGVSPARPEPHSVNPLEAIRLGVRETYATLAQTVTGIGDIIARRQPADQVGGPILMAEVTARVIELGIEPLLRWTALISANIGLLNLLPIPVLDGGHLVFYAIEAIRRRPLSRRVQEIGFQVGLALVMMLVVFVNLNDILRVGRRWLFGDG